MPHTPPIGLRSIELQNFRRVDSLRLSFLGPTGEASDIAVLGGPNGGGKTSVLEACLIALGYDGALQGKNGPDAARSGAREWRLKSAVQTPHGVYEVDMTSSGQTQWQNQTKGIASAPVAVPCLYFSSWRAPKLVGSLPISVGRPGKRPKDTEQNRVWRAKQHLIDSKAHSLMYGGGLYPNGGYQDELSRLNEVWLLFHPRSGDRFEVGPVSRDPNEGFDVFLCCSDGRRVGVDSLSSGQLELFAFFGALLLAKFSQGVVVIDEPELHLDPQWHALMLRAFRKFLPEAQFLVATHSPRVYDAVYSFQRHFLVSDDDPRARTWSVPAGEVQPA